jgi:hypothetical protein
VNARAAKNGPGGKPKQFENLIADARALGCNAAHLRRVLMGERTSPKLMARYRALQQTHTAAIQGRKHTTT